MRSIFLITRTCHFGSSDAVDDDDFYEFTEFEPIAYTTYAAAMIARSKLWDERERQDKTGRFRFRGEKITELPLR